jgi:hypothetical protein
LSSLLRSRIVTEAGQTLGTVADVDFDPKTLGILDVEYDTGKSGAVTSLHQPIAPADILGVEEGVIRVSNAAKSWTAT